MLHENQELFAEIIKSEVTTEDLIAVSYRKKQLDIYETLLTDQNYLESIKSKNSTTNEGLWQKYFENNSWVFGYGLG